MPLRSSARLLAWLFALLLAGCASQGPRPTGMDSPMTDLSSIDSIQQRLDVARQLLAEQRTEDAEVALSVIQFDQLSIAEQTD